VGLAAEVHISDADAGRAQQRIKVTERLGSDVLEDEDLAHGGAWCGAGELYRAAAQM
jgi:hypothetical protein